MPSTSPSYKPSVRDSAQPSQLPTNSPIQNEFNLNSITEKDVTITLTGVLPLNEVETEYFAERTQAYIEFYYNGAGEGSNRRKMLQSVFRGLNIADDNIFDVTVTISNISMNPALAKATNGRKLRNDFDSSSHVAKTATTVRANTRTSTITSTNTSTAKESKSSSLLASRKLAGEELQIEYDQTMTYRYSGKTDEESLTQITNKLLVQNPFNTITRRDEYIIFLKGGLTNLTPAAAAFDNLDKVTPPELYVKSEAISLVAIIAIAAGGVVFLILIVVLICWKRSKGKTSEDDLRDYDPTSRTRGGNRILPESDQSTLAEPNYNGIFTTQDSVIGGGGPGSMATDDPDYNHNVYGFGDQTIASNTDGTMGDATMQSSRFSAGGSLLGAGAGQSLFDEQSFEAYRNRGSGRREEVIEIYAPAGKLGVVIDTPDSGAPVLHRIKDTCPIADKLRIGDKLIAVDDEDVRSMTAVKVSKLISQKSANSTRKFTIMRSI